MKIPPVNAELTSITRGTAYSSDGGGGGTVLAGTIWAGTVDAYVTETIAFAELANRIEQDERTQVVVPSLIGGSVTVEVGDELTYTRGTATHTRYVTSLEDRSDFGFIRTFTTELE